MSGNRRVPHPPATCAYPTQEDLITQAEKVKAIDNSTRTWVYRQGQGAPLSWTIGQKYFGPGGGGKYRALVRTVRFAGALLALSDNPAHLALARDAKVPRDAGHSRSVHYGDSHGP